MREPLLFPLACLVAGIGLSRALPFNVPELATTGLTLLVVLAVALWKAGRKVRFAAGAAVLVIAGILVDVAHRPGPPPELDADVGETVILFGCVVQPSVIGRDRQRFMLELGPDAVASVSVPAGPDVPQPRPLAYGTRVEVDAKIRKPHNYQNPGAFDFERYLARQHIYWYASVPRWGEVRVQPGHCGSRMAGFIASLRSAGLERIGRLYPGDEYSSGLMQAILLGESSKLERVWTDNFRRTGTYHALVISGLHVSVLAGVLLFLLRVCMTGETTALAIAAAVAWLYAGVSGWSAPVIRAAGGFTIYLAARFLFRRGRVLNILAAIAIVYLCLDPNQMFDASFLLSFLAVAALGAIAAPVLELTSGPLKLAPRFVHDRGYDLRVPRQAAALRVELRLLAETASYWTPFSERHALAALSVVVRLVLWAYEMLVISAVVQFALGLAMILYFHRISVTGLTANLLIVPLMSAVVPIGFAAIFTGWTWVAAIAQGLLVLSERIAEFHARFEPAYRVADPPLWLAVAFAASLLLLCWGLRRTRAIRWATFATAALLFGFMLWPSSDLAIAPGRLELTAVDVGQGDGLFVAFPDGRTMLVDGGGIPTFGSAAKPRIDTGEDVVSPYLWSRRLQHVDVIASTHGHVDHTGGLPALMRNFRPAEVWCGANGDIVKHAAADLGIRVREPKAGESMRFGGAVVDVLAPLADYVPGEKPENDDSLVLRIRYGRHAFLLTGDIDGAVEAEILSRADFGHIDVLKVAHHGGRKSTTVPFLELARPEFAVVSAGYGNMFGHPSSDVLGRLAETHTGVYRTDRDGLVTFRSDGRRITVETWAATRATRGLFLPGFGPD